MIRYEEFERERLDPIYDTVAPYSEMARNERYFLNGIIRYHKPKKILEVGVSSGGGSALILNAIRDIEGAELYSVDYRQTAYRHPDKPSGFLVEEKFSELMGKWHVYRGGDVSRFVEEIGGDVDLLMLDTVHSHPWEILNFLCVFPFMKKDSSWVVLHDILTNVCRYLFGTVVSDKKVSPVSDIEGVPANIGAFMISDVTAKYIDDLLGCLLIRWECPVLPEDFSDMKKVIGKHYTPEQYKLFCDAYDFQENLKGRKYGKKSFLEALKLFVKSWQPVLYSHLAHALKH